MNNKTKAAETKTGKPALVPKLRFPEFRNTPEWEEKTLGQLGDLVAGLTYSPDDVTKCGLLVLRSSNIQDGCITLQDNVYVTPDIKGANFSKANDILICVRNGSKGLIGKNALIPEGLPLCTHGAFMTVFRSKSWKFVFQLFKTALYQQQVNGDLGATINSINGGNFLKYKFYVPLPPEQEKIADCLSSVDELIAAQAQKVEALKAHKKGLMQLLFPAEGETLPKLRFPEFRNAPEWETKLLGDVINYENGKAHEQNISDTGKYIVVNSKFISTEGAVRKFTNDGFCIAHKGEILMVLSDVPNGRAIAKCYLVDQDNFYTVNQRICRIKPKKNISEFIFNIINRNSFYLGFDDGVRQTNLRKEDVLACPITMPPTSAEQQKIADCLLSVDELITAQAQKVEALKAHKKGLMQQLFLTPLNEIGG